MSGEWIRLRDGTYIKPSYVAAIQPNHYGGSVITVGGHQIEADSPPEGLFELVQELLASKATADTKPRAREAKKRKLPRANLHKTDPNA